MPVGTVQVYDTGLEELFENLWEAGNHAFVLVNKTYTPSDTHTAYSNISANVIAPSGTQSQGAPIAVGAKAVNRSGAQAQLDSNDADWGTSATITAKYLVCVRGNASSLPLNATDRLVFWLDLDTTSSTSSVSSNNSTFKVAPPTAGWLTAQQS